MTYVDPAFQKDKKREEIEFWKDYIRNNRGTPPFNNSEAWQQANQEVLAEGMFGKQKSLPNILLNSLFRLIK